jgi:hypothetical protein
MSRPPASAPEPQAPLGVLTLDTRFPRIRGDIGCAGTFAFPTVHAVVPQATPAAIVHGRSRERLAQFIAQGRALATAGCIGITTTCGFLARWQAALAAALPVPVLSSSLLQVPLVARTLPASRRVGIVTYSADDLDAEVLAGAGVAGDTPVVGVDPQGYFATAIREGAETLDAGRMAADVVDAARRLARAHAGVGAIVLECANMPPYRSEVAAAVGLPVYDAAQLVAWFYAGLGAARDAGHDLLRQVW